MSEQAMASWLESLTGGGAPGSFTERALLISGERTVATNGYAVTVVQGRLTEHTINNSGHLESLLFPQLREYSSFAIDLSRLRAWLPPDEDPPVCATCKGGEVKTFECKACGGSGEDNCPHCDSEIECDDCDGSGKTDECPECRGETPKIQLRCAHVAPGVVVDQRTLKRFLGPLEAETVTVHTCGEYDPVFFITPMWTVLVMPRKHIAEELGPMLKEEGQAKP